MSNYTRLKQGIRDELKNHILEDFSDLIDIQISLMSWYRHSYCAEKNGYITHDETIIIGCTMKALVKSISYSLYHNEMISIDDLIKLFDEKIKFYEDC